MTPEQVPQDSTRRNRLMTKDNIIAMAKESGLEVAGMPHYQPQIERFARLVAAREREKVAQWQIGSGYSTGHGDTIEDLLVELEWQVREKERDACAIAALNAPIKTARQEQREACANAIRGRNDI